MSGNNKEDILLMAIFTVTKGDVRNCASELGMPEEQVTDDVIELVKEAVSQELADFRGVIRGMIKKAMNKKTTECPLGMVCSPSCAWHEVGECALPRKVG